MPCKWSDEEIRQIQDNSLIEEIISYKDAFIEHSSDALCIVMEYADDGDLL